MVCVSYLRLFYIKTYLETVQWDVPMGCLFVATAKEIEEPAATRDDSRPHGPRFVASNLGFGFYFCSDCNAGTISKHTTWPPNTIGPMLDHEHQSHSLPHRSRGCCDSPNMVVTVAVFGKSDSFFTQKKIMRRKANEGRYFRKSRIAKEAVQSEISGSRL